MTTVDELRDALLDDLDRDGVVIIDHDGFVDRLDTIVAAAEARGRAGLVDALVDIYYRLESAIGHLDGAPEQVVQDVYFTFKDAERAAERAGIIGPDPVASVLDVATPAAPEPGR